MNRYIKYLLIAAIIVFFGLLIIFFIFKSILSVPKKIYVITSESYYIDYEINNDQVEIQCYITIKNTYNINKTIELSATLPDDKTNGLLKTSLIYAKSSDGTISKFEIESNSTASFEVTFIGDFGGKNIKQDRLLPEIVITEIE